MVLAEHSLGVLQLLTAAIIMIAEIIGLFIVVLGIKLWMKNTGIPLREDRPTILILPETVSPVEVKEDPNSKIILEHAYHGKTYSLQITDTETEGTEAKYCADPYNYKWSL